MKKVTIILVIFLVLLLFSPTAYAAPRTSSSSGSEEKISIWVIAESGLNLREGPGLEYEKLGCVKYGTKLTKISEYKDWSIVLYKEKIYCVFSKYTTTNKDDIATEIPLGSYRITFYCGCSKCNGKWAGGPTASGKYAQEGVTVASGPEFPFGTKLLIQGHIYTVQDRGVPNGCIDIYLDSHSECNRRGLYYTDIYLIEK